MLHQKIYEDFVSQTKISKSQDEIGTSTLAEFLPTIFQNWTTAFPSFKLTNTGFIVLKRMYQCWKIPINQPDQNLFSNGQMLLYLHNHIQFPYYYDRNCFYVFSNQAALELEMANGDIKLWSQMFG